MPHVRLDEFEPNAQFFALQRNSAVESHRKGAACNFSRKVFVLKLLFSKVMFGYALLATTALAETTPGKAWVEAMNACEALISDQSFVGFTGYTDAQSILDVEPRLERGFQHPELRVNSSAISSGSEWFLCVVTGDTGTGAGAIIGTVTGTLLAQIREHGDLSMIFKDGQTFAPVRVVCHDDGRLTSVFAYYTIHKEFRVAATNRLPNGVKSPCQ